MATAINPRNAQKLATPIKSWIFMQPGPFAHNANSFKQQEQAAISHKWQKKHVYLWKITNTKAMIQPENNGPSKGAWNASKTTNNHHNEGSILILSPMPGNPVPLGCWQLTRRQPQARRQRQTTRVTTRPSIDTPRLCQIIAIQRGSIA